MKFTSYILHTIVAGAAVLAIVGTVRASGNESPDESGAEAVFAEVVNPPVPASLTLCGQRVDLDRVDNFERLDRELTSLTYTHGNTLLVLKRANRYFPQIAPVLRNNGMPDDLLYLAVTESMLNPRAVSGARAGGMWQFMPSTAKEYGLEVSDEVDERFNIEKATAAACRYFKRALSLYDGNWMSVMAAYNGGMGRITKQLNAQMAKDALDLYLNDETSRYPFRVMAYKTIMENPADYGFRLTPGQLYQPRVVDIVEVDGPVDDWVVWAREHGISYATLRDENPWIRAPKLTNKSGKTYSVRVPRKESLSRSKSTKSVYNKNWVTK